MTYTYKYPKPSVTVDCVIFGFDEEDLKVLLIQRDLEPFAGKWALPGGFVHLDETLDDAARRELAEETGVSELFLEQLYTFGDVHRDPRERVITVAYYALVNLHTYNIQASSDARYALWFPVNDIPELAFDHERIIDAALKRLKSKVRYQPIGFELLPPEFTLSQLQHLYETILEVTLDKRNFRKKFLGMDLLIELDEVEQDVAHRAARLFQFDVEKYKKLTQQGFNFEI